MILRRLAQNLKEQNWTAIGIEFVLLVMGVFLGIQVSNWNEARQTREKSIMVTERLKDDLRREVQRYRFLQEYYRDVREATEKSANALIGTAPLSNEALLINAFRATQYRASRSHRSNYDALTSTGNLGLIEDRTLLDLAIAAYGLTSLNLLARDAMESEYRSWFRMSIPHEVQRVLATQCGDRLTVTDGKPDYDQMIDYACATNLPADGIDTAAKTLRSDPQVLRILRKRIVDLDSRLDDLDGNIRNAFEKHAEVIKIAP